jgi:hypothetical protein
MPNRLFFFAGPDFVADFFSPEFFAAIMHLLVRSHF